MRTITVPAGIGDNVWLLQKLVNQPEKINFIIPGSNPQRGKQVFDLLPSLVHSSTYGKPISYRKLSMLNEQKKYKNWNLIRSSTFSLTCNEHLEAGKRIEQFLPDLSTSFTIDWQIQDHDDLKQFEYTIGIYGSSYSTSRAWNFWQEKEWTELITKIHSINSKITFVIIGAEWDLDLSSKLITILEEQGISYFNTVGKPLSYVMATMKKLNYAFYFPSGLPIISETLHPKTDCVMFYPPHLQKMMGTWRDPSRGIGFKETQFCSPDQIFNWVKDEYKLFDRL